MANTYKVRNFIKAKSEIRLRSLMYKKQIDLKMSALEFDITYARGFWFAWYYEILNNDNLKEIVTNDKTQDNRG